MGRFLKCTFCGSQNLNPDATCRNCGAKNNILLAQEFAMTDEEEAISINEYRNKLVKAINAFDYQEINNYASEILGILPDDFLAGYYLAYTSRVFYDDQSYVEFLSKPDFTYATEEAKDEVLKHLILTCPLRYNKYISNFITKAFDDPTDQNRYFQMLYKETKRKENENVDEDTKRDAFILYGDKDKDLANDILELLEDEQLKCFIAPRDLGHNPKTRYDDIAMGIRNSKCLVIVGTKSFLDSEECINEAQYAQRINKKIIYFRVDEASSDAYSSFRHVYVVDAAINQYQKFEQLLFSVLISVTENEETKEELLKEFYEIKARDAALDEEYRNEQKNQIAKLEAELLAKYKEEKPVSADLEYVLSLKNSLAYIAVDDFTNAKACIVDCERNYPDYTCTIVLNLAYLLRRIYQPGVNVDATLLQIKELNAKIVLEDEDMSIDEKAVYLKLDDDDIYGLLVHLFYTLGDEKRLDFVSSLIHYDNIKSEIVFQAVIDYLLAEGYYKPLYQLLNKRPPQDKNLTLTKILMKYKDGDAKLDIIESLIKNDAYDISDSNKIENYLKKTEDSINTKILVVVYASKKQIYIDGEILIRYCLFNATDTKYITPVFDLLPSENFTYDYFILILDFALTRKCQNEIIGLKVVSDLLDKNLRYELDYKIINDFLQKPYFGLDSKIDMLKLLCKFKMSKKSFDSIMNYYLCFNQSDVSERIKILEILFNTVKDIPITALERYVCQSNYDGDQKPLIVQMLLDLNMNPLYFSQILANYLIKNNDDEDVMKRVVLQLCNRKLTLGTQEFIKYIKEQRIDENVIRILVENGQTVRPECLEYYLDRLSDSFMFSEVIFNALYTKNVKLTDKAFSNYVMYGFGEKKYDYVIEFSRNCQDNIKNIRLSIPFAQDYIGINICQAYLLKNKDDDVTSEKIIKSFTLGEVFVNEDIIIGAKKIKAKKYLQGVGSFVTPHIATMCKKFGL